MSAADQLVRGYPFTVLAEVHPVTDRTDSLAPEERVTIDNAVAKRRREFSTGRWLAKKLLAEADHETAALPSDPDRVPRWPDGILGSISHDDGLCVAVVSRANGIAGIGVDVELSAPLEEGLWSLIMRPEEQVECGACAPGAYAKLLFSAKEAIYKAVYPERRNFLEFLDVRAHIDQERQTFFSQIQEDRVDGFYFIADGHVFSGAYRYA